MAVWKPELGDYQWVWDAVCGVSAGNVWPEGNEDDLWALAEEWQTVADALNDAIGDGGAAVADLMAAWGGDSGAAFMKLWQNFGMSPESGLPAVASMAGSLSSYADNAAMQLQYSKLTTLITVIITVISIFLALVSAYFTLGASTASIQPILMGGRQAVLQAFRELIKNLARRLVDKELRAALLKHLAKDLGKELVEELIEEVVLTDGLAQAYQMATGTRDKWDGRQTAASAVGAAAGVPIGAVVAPAAQFGRRAARRGLAAALPEGAISRLNQRVARLNTPASRLAEEATRGERRAARRAGVGKHLSGLPEEALSAGLVNGVTSTLANTVASGVVYDKWTLPDADDVISSAISGAARANTISPAGLAAAGIISGREGLREGFWGTHDTAAPIAPVTTTTPAWTSGVPQVSTDPADGAIGPGDRGGTPSASMVAGPSVPVLSGSGGSSGGVAAVLGSVTGTPSGVAAPAAPAGAGVGGSSPQGPSAGASPVPSAAGGPATPSAAGASSQAGGTQQAYRPTPSASESVDRTVAQGAARTGSSSLAPASQIPTTSTPASAPVPGSPPLDRATSVPTSAISNPPAGETASPALASPAGETSPHRGDSAEPGAATHQPTTGTPLPLSDSPTTGTAPGHPLPPRRNDFDPGPGGPVDITPGLAPSHPSEAAPSSDYSRSRPIDQPGGLVVPDAVDQQALDHAVPRDVHGRPDRFPSPLDGWVGLVNDGGAAATPSRANNCLDTALSLLATWQGDPQVSAPRTVDLGMPDRGETNGTRRAEAVLGARFTHHGGDPAVAYEGIAEQLRVAGHGASALIVTSNTDEQGGGAHAWNAVNHEGTVYWVDGQTDSVATSPLRTEGTAGVWSIGLNPDGQPLAGSDLGAVGTQVDAPHEPGTAPGSSPTPTQLLMDAVANLPLSYFDNDVVDIDVGSYWADVELSNGDVVTFEIRFDPPGTEPEPRVVLGAGTEDEPHLIVVSGKVDPKRYDGVWYTAIQAGIAVEHAAAAQNGQVVMAPTAQAVQPPTGPVGPFAGNVPSRPLRETRAFKKRRLRPIEHEAFQDDLENALASGTDYLVGADPMTHLYGRLVNDGGSTKPGRGNNCLDCSLAALSSFYGRPEVSAPRWRDPVPPNTEPGGEVRGPRRALAWLGATEWLNSVDHGPLTGSEEVGRQFAELDARITQLGPGSAALVINEWHDYDADGVLLYDSDGMPESGGAHATLVVFPYGASRPVWWDPQAGTAVPGPPADMVARSNWLVFVTIEADGKINGTTVSSSSVGDSGGSANIPVTGLRARDGVDAAAVRVRVGDQAHSSDAGRDRAGPGSGRGGLAVGGEERPDPVISLPGAFGGIAVRGEDAPRFGSGRDSGLPGTTTTGSTPEPGASGPESAGRGDKAVLLREEASGFSELEAVRDAAAERATQTPVDRLATERAEVDLPRRGLSGGRSVSQGVPSDRSSRSGPDRAGADGDRTALGGGTEPALRGVPEGEREAVPAEHRGLSEQAPSPAGFKAGSITAALEPSVPTGPNGTAGISPPDSDPTPAVGHSSANVVSPQAVARLRDPDQVARWERESTSYFGHLAERMRRLQTWFNQIRSGGRAVDEATARVHDDVDAVQALDEHIVAATAMAGALDEQARAADRFADEWRQRADVASNSSIFAGQEALGRAEEARRAARRLHLTRAYQLWSSAVHARHEAVQWAAHRDRLLDQAETWTTQATRGGAEAARSAFEVGVTRARAAAIRERLAHEQALLDDLQRQHAEAQAERYGALRREGHLFHPGAPTTWLDQNTDWIDPTSDSARPMRESDPLVQTAAVHGAAERTPADQLRDPDRYRAPLVAHQRLLEAALAQDFDDFPPTRPRVTRGSWFQRINAFGHEADPSRRVDSSDAVRAFVDTYHGRPRVAAPVVRDYYQNNDATALGHRAPSQGVDEDWTGGRYQRVMSISPDASPDVASTALDRGAARIRIALDRTGDGAVALITTRWRSGPAHTWAAVNEGGRVVWVDPQSGAISTDFPFYGSDVVHMDTIVLDRDGNPAPIQGEPLSVYSVHPPTPAYHEALQPPALPPLADPGPPSPGPMVLTAHTLLDVVDHHVRPEHFPGYGVVSIQTSPHLVAIDLSDGRRHLVEVRSDARLAWPVATALGEGTARDPHVITFNGGLDPNQLAPVWVSEINKVLAHQPEALPLPVHPDTHPGPNSSEGAFGPFASADPAPPLTGTRAFIESRLRRLESPSFQEDVVEALHAALGDIVGADPRRNGYGGLINDGGVDEDGRRTNCLDCSLAAISSFYGQPQVAVPLFVDPSDPDNGEAGGMQRAMAWLGASEWLSGAESLNQPGDSRVARQYWGLHERIAALKEGSAAVVVHDWHARDAYQRHLYRGKEPAYHGAHATVVVFPYGAKGPVWWDPQSGEMSLKPPATTIARSAGLRFVTIEANGRINGGAATTNHGGSTGVPGAGIQSVDPVAHGPVQIRLEPDVDADGRTSNGAGSASVDTGSGQRSRIRIPVVGRGSRDDLLHGSDGEGGRTGRASDLSTTSAAESESESGSVGTDSAGRRSDGVLLRQGPPGLSSRAEGVDQRFEGTSLHVPDQRSDNPVGDDDGVVEGISRGLLGERPVRERLSATAQDGGGAAPLGSVENPVAGRGDTDRLVSPELGDAAPERAGDIAEPSSPRSAASPDVGGPDRTHQLAGQVGSAWSDPAGPGLTLRRVASLMRRELGPSDFASGEVAGVDVGRDGRIEVRLTSGKTLLIRMVIDPSARAAFVVTLGDGAEGNPHVIAVDGDLSRDELRQALAGGISQTVDDHRSEAAFTSDLNRSVVPGPPDGPVGPFARNDPPPSVDQTRTYGPGRLAPLEKRLYQHLVERALRAGDRFIVGADPSVNPFGALINDGGIGMPNRASNCVDSVLAGLASFYGKPTVSVPRHADEGRERDLGEVDGEARIRLWVGADRWLHLDAQPSISERVWDLHDHVRHLGPGSAVIVYNQWQAHEGGRLRYEADGDPVPGDSHVSLVVFPYGAAGPVWWDPQAGVTSQRPFADVAAGSTGLSYITIEMDGRVNGGAPGRHGGGAGVPGPDAGVGRGLGDGTLRARLGAPMDPPDTGGHQARQRAREIDPGVEREDGGGHLPRVVPVGRGDSAVQQGGRGRDEAGRRPDLSAPDSTGSGSEPGQVGTDTGRRLDEGVLLRGALSGLGEASDRGVGSGQRAARDSWAEPVVRPGDLDPGGRGVSGAGSVSGDLAADRPGRGGADPVGTVRLGAPQRGGVDRGVPAGHRNSGTGEYGGEQGLTPAHPLLRARPSSELAAVGIRRVVLEDLGFTDHELAELPSDEREGLERALRLEQTRMVDPASLRFSQRSISYTTSGGKDGGRLTIQELAGAIRVCWRGGPLHAVLLGDGSLMSLDNRRLAAARMAGQASIPVVVHSPTELLDGDWRADFPGNRVKQGRLSVDIRQRSDGTWGTRGEGPIVYQAGARPRTFGEFALFRAADGRSRLPARLFGSDSLPVRVVRPSRPSSAESSPDAGAQLDAAIEAATTDAAQIGEDLGRLTHTMAQRGPGAPVLRNTHDAVLPKREVTQRHRHVRHLVDSRAFVESLDDMVTFMSTHPSGPAYVSSVEALLVGLEQRGYRLLSLTDRWQPANRSFGLVAVVERPGGGRRFELHAHTDLSWTAYAGTADLRASIQAGDESSAARVHSLLAMLANNIELGLSEESVPSLRRLAARWPDLWETKTNGFASWEAGHSDDFGDYRLWLQEQSLTFAWIINEFGLDVADLGGRTTSERRSARDSGVLRPVQGTTAGRQTDPRAGSGRNRGQEPQDIGRASLEPPRRSLDVQPGDGQRLPVRRAERGSVSPDRQGGGRAGGVGGHQGGTPAGRGHDPVDLRLEGRASGERPGPHVVQPGEGGAPGPGTDGPRHAAHIPGSGFDGEAGRRRPWLVRMLGERALRGIADIQQQADGSFVVLTPSLVVPVRLVVGPVADRAVATFVEDGAGGVRITVSERARLRDVTRSIHHELAEFLAERAGVPRDPVGNYAAPGVLTTQGHGRQAEIDVLRGRMMSLNPFTRARALADLDALLVHLGLGPSSIDFEDRVTAFAPDVAAFVREHAPTRRRVLAGQLGIGPLVQGLRVTGTGRPSVDQLRGTAFRAPMVEHQRLLEETLAREFDGFPPVRPRVTRGSWFGRINAFAYGVDPLRRVDSSDAVRAFLDTYHGRPRVAAPAMPENGEVPAPRAPSQGVDEAWTGGRYQQVMAVSASHPPAVAAVALDQGAARIRIALDRAGDGSVALITTRRMSGAVHAWAAVNEGGRIVWVDPQRGWASADFPFYGLDIAHMDTIVLDRNGNPVPIPGVPMSVYSVYEPTPPYQKALAPPSLPPMVNQTPPSPGPKVLTGAAVLDAVTQYVRPQHFPAHQVTGIHVGQRGIAIDLAGGRRHVIELRVDARLAWPVVTALGQGSTLDPHVITFHGGLDPSQLASIWVSQLEQVLAHEPEPLLPRVHPDNHPGPNSSHGVFGPFASLDPAPPLSGTRAYIATRLRRLENAAFQDDVSGALRVSSGSIVGADPRSNRYGQLINDGGAFQPNRDTNCLDCSLAAISSFYGQPQVAVPHFADPASPGTGGGEVGGPQRAAAWLGARDWIDARTLKSPSGSGMSGQYWALHHRIAQLGKGSSAVVLHDWHARDADRRHLYSDKQASARGGHATVVVYPYGAEGPVWWDPQSGVVSSTPPATVIARSVGLKFITIEANGRVNGGAAVGDDGGSAGVPGPGVRSVGPMGDVPVRVRMGDGGDPEHRRAGRTPEGAGPARLGLGSQQRQGVPVPLVGGGHGDEPLLRSREGGKTGRLPGPSALAAAGSASESGEVGSDAAGRDGEGLLLRGDRGRHSLFDDGSGQRSEGPSLHVVGPPGTVEAGDDVASMAAAPSGFPRGGSVSDGSPTADQGRGETDPLGSVEDPTAGRRHFDRLVSPELSRDASHPADDGSLDPAWPRTADGPAGDPDGSSGLTGGNEAGARGASGLPTGDRVDGNWSEARSPKPRSVEASTTPNVGTGPHHQDTAPSEPAGPGAENIGGYRKQTDHPDSKRLVVGGAGNVSIQGSGFLFVNLSGDIGHSLAFRGSGGEVIEFKVTRDFVDRVRSLAVGQRKPADFRGGNRDWNLMRKSRPQLVDPTKGRDLYGIPPSMFDDFVRAIVPGSGRIR